MTRRRTWIVAGALGVVVVLVAGVWIWQVASRPASAEDAALAYLRALESGDADALTAVSTEQPQGALDALSAAQERITDSSVTSIEQDTGAATAEVSFALADDRHTTSLHLVQADGRWRVDDSGLGSIRVDASEGSFVDAGDVPFSAGEELSLFPAAYVISALPADLLDGTADAIVLPGESTDLSLEATVLPAAVDAAQEALDEHLADCTRGGETVPSGCGIRIPWGTEFRSVSEIRYRVEANPVLALDLPGFDAAGGTLVATVAGTGQDGAARTTTYRTESWLVRGDVAFSETGIELSVW